MAFLLTFTELSLVHFIGFMIQISVGSSLWHSSYSHSSSSLLLTPYFAIFNLVLMTPVLILLTFFYRFSYGSLPCGRYSVGWMGSSYCTWVFFRGNLAWPRRCFSFTAERIILRRGLSLVLRVLRLNIELKNLETFLFFLYLSVPLISDEDLLSRQYILFIDIGRWRPVIVK